MLSVDSERSFPLMMTVVLCSARKVVCPPITRPFHTWEVMKASRASLAIWPLQLSQTM